MILHPFIQSLLLLFLVTRIFAFEETGYKISAGASNTPAHEDQQAFSAAADIYWSVDPLRRFAFGLEAGGIAYNQESGVFDSLYYGEFVARLSPTRNNFRYMKNVDIKVGYGFYNGSVKDDIAVYGFGIKTSVDLSLNNKYSLGIEYRYIPLNSDIGHIERQFLLLQLHVTPDIFWKSHNAWFNY